MTPRHVLHPVLTKVDGDAINPGAELGVAAELSDGFEDLDEDLLGHVLRFVAPPEHAEHQREHAVLVELNELVERSLVVRPQALDELTLAGFVRFGHAPPSLE